MALTTCGATTQPVRIVPVVCERLREASEWQAMPRVLLCQSFFQALHGVHTGPAGACARWSMLRRTTCWLRPPHG
jgi:hypothetical protein